MEINMISFFRPNDAKEAFLRLNNAMSLINTDSDGRIKKQSGVYIIYKDGLCLYVGQSKNLASRITTHIFGKYETADKIFFIFEEDFIIDVSLDKMEAGLIERLNPIENVLVDHSADNSRVLEMLTDTRGGGFGLILQKETSRTKYFCISHETTIAYTYGYDDERLNQFYGINEAVGGQ